MRCIAVLCLLLSFSLQAAESDALAISANIQARHLPFGTILDPIFVAPDSDQIVNYTRCGDSAIWTGHYLAAEAYRYQVTTDPRALSNARGALTGLTLLADVTGTNLLARCAVLATSAYTSGIVQEEAANGSSFGAVNGQAYVWIGNTSRDQYLGVFFGLATAYDLIGDAQVRADSAALATRLLQFLVDHAWNVVQPDGTISTTFLIRPDEQLTLLQIGRHLNPAKFDSLYSTFSAEAPLMGIPIGVDDSDPRSSYFKFNLDAIDFDHLLPLESGSFDKFFYKEAYGSFRGTVAGHQNAFFNMIDRAINGPNPQRDADTISYLEQWLLRPRRDVPVDLRGVYPACGAAGQACNPIPIAQRVPAQFLWQDSPFQLVGGGSGIIESAGIDYILPYWMARYYGILAGDTNSNPNQRRRPVKLPQHPR